MTWFGISFTYIRFHKGFKVQGYDRSKLPYASQLQPYAAWYAMIACLVICFVRLDYFDSILWCDTYSRSLPMWNSSAVGKSSWKIAGTLLLSSPTTSLLLSSPLCILAPGSGDENPLLNLLIWTLSVVSRRSRLNGGFFLPRFGCG